jgi:hypothetical protein
MPEFVSVLQGEGSSTVVTVTRERAEALGLEVLDQPAVDRRGRPLGPREIAQPASELKGAALDEALEEAGLPKSGSADEKRKRLAAHTNTTGFEEGSK